MLVLPLVLASAAACGSNEANVGTTTSPSTHTQGTDLTVSVTAKPGAEPRTWTLRCDPPGGTLPDAAKACAALAKAKKPFRPTPKHQMCTQIYGGPQHATIKGTWKGRQVSASYSRKNGCEIHRWNAIKPVLNHKS